MTQYIIQSVSFKTYLCGEGNTKVNQKKAIGEWERFTLEKEEDYYYIKSCHNTYLMNDINGEVRMSPNRAHWERWWISKTQDGYYSIRSIHNKYLRCHDQKGIVNSTNVLGPWETWVVVKVVDKSRWMEAIGDEQNLACLTIPGTHDSASYNVKGFIASKLAETQSLTIEQSLYTGTRFLDIRLRLIGNFLVLHHGVVYLNQNFDDVLTTIDNFLKARPREIVLMRIKQEHTSEGSNITFEASFQNYVNKYNHLFYQSEAVPTLGQVRGKIVIISDHYPYVPGKSWSSNIIEDKWEVIDLKHKTEGINCHINNRINTCQREIYTICFFSGYYAKEMLNPLKVLNPKRFAEDINPWALSNIPLPRSNCDGLGVLVFDFLTEEITNRVVSSNPLLYLDL